MEVPADATAALNIGATANDSSRPSLYGNWFFAAMRAIADQVNLVRPR